MILAKYPLTRGILFDLPPVIEGAPELLRNCGVEHRVELRGGDFFRCVPGGADAYLLNQILHDWSDADCVRILKTIHTASRPGAKLLLEAIVEAGIWKIVFIHSTRVPPTQADNPGN